MKSLLGMLFTVLLFIVVVGGGALIWYLNHTAEFSLKATPDSSETAPPPANR